MKEEIHFTHGGIVLIWEQRQFTQCDRWKTEVSTEEGKFVGPSGSFLNCLYFLSKMKNKVIKKVRVKDKVL